jgi:hypothetical protein
MYFHNIRKYQHVVAGERLCAVCVESVSGTGNDVCGLLWFGVLSFSFCCRVEEKPEDQEAS